MLQPLDMTLHLQRFTHFLNITPFLNKPQLEIADGVQNYQCLEYTKYILLKKMFATIFSLDNSTQVSKSQPVFRFVQSEIKRSV